MSKLLFIQFIINNGRYNISITYLKNLNMEHNIKHILPEGGSVTKTCVGYLAVMRECNPFTT